MTSKAFRSGTRRNKHAAAKRKAAPGTALQHTTKAAPRLVWITVKEAAAIIGWSQTTMRNRIKDGDFPSKPAGTMRKQTLVGLDANIWPVT